MKLQDPTAMVKAGGSKRYCHSGWVSNLRASGSRPSGDGLTVEDDLVSVGGPGFEAAEIESGGVRRSGDKVTGQAAENVGSITWRRRRPAGTR